MVTEDEVYAGVDAYMTYLALKMHFTSPSYDYFKYGGKTNTKRESFLKRRDRYFFAKLERKHQKKELVRFFVANMINNRKAWIGSMTGADGEKTFNEWTKKIQSLKYTFTEECKYLAEKSTLDNLLTAKDHQPAPICALLVTKKVSLETFTILDMLVSFTKTWNDDFISSQHVELANKYRPFIAEFVTEETIGQYKKIARECFSVA